MRVREALNAAMRRLEDNEVGSPRMNAEVLLMFTLGVGRAYLYAHPEQELGADELRRYDDALAQRSRGVPSQYIVGHQEFWGLDLVVTPAVLIPRPETEHLVEAVLELVKTQQRDRPSIVDVGTGSGCVALALAHELPRAQVQAVDISPHALEVASANAARLRLSDRVCFAESDLLGAFDARPQFDFVVSNPPYVGEGEEDRVQREVKKFEPRIAVFAGSDGLDTIRRLIPQARERLNVGGWLLTEIGFTQERAVLALLDGWCEVHSIPDLQGIPRVVAARNT